MVTDAAANWTAMEIFSFAFLKDLYQDRHDVEDCQFFPYKTEFKSLRDVFNMSTSRALMKAGSKPWYVGWLVSHTYDSNNLLMIIDSYNCARYFFKPNVHRCQGCSKVSRIFKQPR